MKKVTVEMSPRNRGKSRINRSMIPGPFPDAVTNGHLRPKGEPIPLSAVPHLEVLVKLCSCVCILGQLQFNRVRYETGMSNKQDIPRNIVLVLCGENSLRGNLN